jgi:ketosteroid isomerase-like protein
MDPSDAVLAANTGFYRAFESLDLPRMNAVWLRERYIGCVHPGWALLVGWGPVMESWERIFAGTLAIQFTLTDVQVQVRGGVAWVTLTEHLESHHRDGKIRAKVQATNLFELRDGKWFLVHHHGSPVAEGPGDAGPARIQ